MENEVYELRITATRKEKLKELLVDSDWELRQFKNKLKPYIREIHEEMNEMMEAEGETETYIRSQWVEVFKLLDIEHELSSN